MTKSIDGQDLRRNSDPHTAKQDPTYQRVADKESPKVLHSAFENHKIEEETERERIKSDDPEFLKLYGPKNIKNIVKPVNPGTKLDNMPKVDKANYEKAQMARLMLFKQINGGWLGESVKAIIPAKKEELSRGIDLIIEFFDPEKNKTFSFVIDIVFEDDPNFASKLTTIRESIKKTILERVVYFKTTKKEVRNDYQDRLRKDAMELRKKQSEYGNEEIFLRVKGIPRFVFGIDNNTFAGMLRIWDSEDGENHLKNNLITRMLFLQEILTQIGPFTQITERFFNSNIETQREILNKYDEVLKAITDIEKANLEGMDPELRTRIEKFLREERVLHIISKIVTSRQFLEGVYSTNKSEQRR